MCGISGMVGRCEPEVIRRMTRLLEHRGPDGEGVALFPREGAALGHRRLAILDLSAAGAQPMAGASGRYWIVYNGEVFNFAQIRAELEGRGRRFVSHCDTEVVLAAYEEWGEDCLARFNGMFAFAIWDRRERALFAARDQLGIKPFYWAEIAGGLLFASEVKAILGSGLVQAEADPDVVANPWPYPSAPRTGFRGIHKLPAGHALHWRDGHATLRRWWALDGRAEPIGDDQAQRRLAELLNDATRLQMIADVPVGALLSGGLDSSLVVALMQRLTGEPVRTFTIRFRDEDQRQEAMPDDAVYARDVAARLGCHHEEIEIAPQMVDLLPRLVWHLDEPLADPAAINTFLIAERARKAGVVVLLSGMGADEVFGGYRRHLACLLADRMQRWLPRFALVGARRAAGAMPVAFGGTGFRRLRWVKRFLGFAALARPERYLASDLSIPAERYADLFAGDAARDYAHLAEVAHRREVFGRGGSSYLGDMCLADCAIYLTDHNLDYTDKATMAAGVEARPPLLDPRIVEFALRLPDDLRIRGRDQKWILRRTAEAWLPHAITRRPKASFGAPLRAWIGRDLREMVDDCLLSPRARGRGIYRDAAVRAAVDADRRGREDNAFLIWNLLWRETWFREFIDGDGLRTACAQADRAARDIPAPDRAAGAPPVQ